VDEILSHPRFPAAREGFVKAILALYEYKPAINRLVEAGRGVLFLTIMCLHARYDEADRATWPTLRLVADALAEHRARQRQPRLRHALAADQVRLGGTAAGTAGSTGRAAVGLADGSRSRPTATAGLEGRQFSLNFLLWHCRCAEADSVNVLKVRPRSSRQVPSR
jgi:hypothetical protein